MKLKKGLFTTILTLVLSVQLASVSVSAHGVEDTKVENEMQTRASSMPALANATSDKGVEFTVDQSYLMRPYAIYEPVIKSEFVLATELEVLGQSIVDTLKLVDTTTGQRINGHLDEITIVEGPKATTGEAFTNANLQTPQNGYATMVVSFVTDDGVSHTLTIEKTRFSVVKTFYVNSLENFNFSEITIDKGTSVLVSDYYTTFVDHMENSIVDKFEISIIFPTDSIELIDFDDIDSIIEHMVKDATGLPVTDTALLEAGTYSVVYSAMGELEISNIVTVVDAVVVPEPEPQPEPEEKPVPKPEPKPEPEKPADKPVETPAPVENNTKPADNGKETLPATGIESASMVGAYGFIAVGSLMTLVARKRKA